MKIKRLLTIVLTLIIAHAPTTAFAAQSSNNTLPQLLANALQVQADTYDDHRMITLTAEAKEIVLYDFDYLVAKILDVAPVQNVIFRRFGITLDEYFAEWREIISENTPMVSILSILYPERWGDEPADDISLAADYLFACLYWITYELGGLGHLSVQHSFFVDQSFFASAYMVSRGMEPDQAFTNWLKEYGYSIDDFMFLFKASYQFNLLHYNIFNIPSVMWFYDLDSTDFNFDFEEGISEALGHTNPYNIVTAILDPGRIAYIHIESFMNNIFVDRETLFPFYREIQDYGHLIIDLRGNMGGWANSFRENVVEMLIDDSIFFAYYELFAARESTAAFFENPLSLAGGILYGIFPVAEFVQEWDMYHFSPYDLEFLDYVIVWAVGHFPSEYNIPFSGKIWLLVDGNTASASEAAAKLSIGTGFATVVGEPTRGSTGVIFTYAAMPNTGILFRIDLGYLVDLYGRSIEEFGIMPQMPNAPGLDALQTVLAVINTDPAFRTPPPPPPMPGTQIPSVQVHPLVGTWAWDVAGSYRYIFHNNGTGERGVPGYMIELFTWSTEGAQLNINLLGPVPYWMIRNERWNFTIADGVLTIDSQQAENLVWRYIRQ